MHIGSITEMQREKNASYEWKNTIRYAAIYQPLIVNPNE